MGMNVGGSVIQTALSGLTAAEKRLGVSAQNVANSTTEGYKAQVATQRTLGDGGVIVDIRNADPASFLVPSTNGEGTTELPNVSLDQEVANQVSAENSFKANVSVLKTQIEMDKALLDIQA